MLHFALPSSLLNRLLTFDTCHRPPRRVNIPPRRQRFPLATASASFVRREIASRSACAACTMIAVGSDEAI
jgi:hypothetical protein